MGRRATVLVGRASVRGRDSGGCAEAPDLAVAHGVEHESQELAGDRAYQALVRLPGVGKVLGALFAAEIGDISRFQSPRQLCSWAGLTPRHRESDAVVHRGGITKQGSPLVRWAAIEAVGNYRAKGNEKLRADYKRIAERRGKYKARVAVARKLLTLVFYAMRDGEVRCLNAPAAA